MADTPNGKVALCWGLVRKWLDEGGEKGRERERLKISANPHSSHEFFPIDHAVAVLVKIEEKQAQVLV